MTYPLNNHVEYPGTAKQKAYIEESWTVAPARTECMNCGRDTFVDVRREVRYLPVEGGKLLKCGKPKKPERVLVPPKRLPRKLCYLCTRIDGSGGGSNAEVGMNRHGSKGGPGKG